MIGIGGGCRESVLAGLHYPKYQDRPSGLYAIFVRRSFIVALTYDFEQFVW